MTLIFDEKYGWCIDMMSSSQNQYNYAKNRLKKLQEKISDSKNTTKDNIELLKLVVSIYGHAWCVDNELERKKLTRLIGKYFVLVPKII